MEGGSNRGCRVLNKGSWMKGECGSKGHMLQYTYPIPPRPKSDILTWPSDLRSCSRNFLSTALRPTKELFFGYGTRTATVLERSVQAK